MVGTDRFRVMLCLLWAPASSPPGGSLRLRALSLILAEWGLVFVDMFQEEVLMLMKGSLRVSVLEKVRTGRYERVVLKGLCRLLLC